MIERIKLLIIGIILLVISAIFAEDITVVNITPNIILPWVVYISIFLPSKYALSFTFFISLANDLLNPQLLGFTTMLFVVISYFISLYHTSVNKEKLTTTVFSMLVVNLLFYLVQWIYFSFTSSQPFALLLKAGITIGYNTLLSVALIYVIYLLDKLRMWFGD